MHRQDPTDEQSAGTPGGEPHSELPQLELPPPTSASGSGPGPGSGSGSGSGSDSLDEARRELATALREGPFHLALRAALTVRGLTLQRVQHRLAQRGVQVGLTSLSYWQQGRRRPERTESLRAVHALEEILDLPSHSLTRLLGPRIPAQAGPPGSPRPMARPYRQLMSVEEVLQDILASMAVPVDVGVHTVCHFERIQVGANRNLLHRDSQQVLRAHQDGVDRYLAIFLCDEGGDVDRVSLRAVENCRPGRVRRDRETGLLVAELLFDRRLRSGDTQLLSYGFSEPEDAPSSTEYLRGFPAETRQYVLQVNFDPTALPVRCRRYVRRSTKTEPEEAEELTLDGHHGVHLVASDIQPSMVGITWDWD